MCHRNLKLVWILKMHLFGSNIKFTSLSRKKKMLSLSLDGLIKS